MGGGGRERGREMDCDENEEEEIDKLGVRVDRMEILNCLSSAILPSLSPPLPLNPGAFSFPNGESGLDVYTRVTSFISTMFRYWQAGGEEGRGGGREGGENMAKVERGRQGM